MDTIKTLRMIAARCPELGRQVGQAVQAINANSPIVEHRLNAIATEALNLAEFSDSEREQVASLLSISETGNQSTTLNIRLSVEEKNHLIVMAEDERVSLSDYVRRKLELE